jgi:hypothetical protein
MCIYESVGTIADIGFITSQPNSDHLTVANHSGAIDKSPLPDCFGKQVAQKRGRFRVSMLNADGTLSPLDPKIEIPPSPLFSNSRWE